MLHASRLCALCLLTLTTFPLARAQYVIPQPPAGWEKEVNPKFKPNIESVLIDLANAPLHQSDHPDYEKMLDTVWAGWGNDAVKEVIRIYEEPRWREFQPYLLWLFNHCPYPDLFPFLESRIRTIAQNRASGTSDTHELYMLFNLMAKHAPSAAWKLLCDLSKPEYTGIRNSVFRGFLALETPDGLAAAERLAASFPESDQKNCQASIEWYKSRMRAKEPMDVILRNEGTVPYAKPVPASVQFKGPKTNAPEALLNEWLDGLKSRKLTPDDIHPPDRHTQRQMANIVRERLERIARVLPDEEPRFGQLPEVAVALGDKSAAKIMENIVLDNRYSAQSWAFGTWHAALIYAIVDLLGDDGCAFLESLAQDQSAAPKVRAQAVIGLGRLGTKRSVAAVIRMRKACSGRIDLRSTDAQPTHADQMAEAVTTTVVGISHAANRAFKVYPETAVVDAKYASGEIRFDEAGSTTVKLKRFGQDWLVVEILSEVIV